MDFNRHSYLKGQHAFLSASKYHWANYDEEKLVASYSRWMAAKRGTDLHELAHRCIELGVKVQTPKTIKLYVNDAIGFKMETEKVLYYSDNCFGTVDSISFRKNCLRIHDLKTGVTPASMQQLIIYAALFCFDFDIKPIDIDMELRIYQLDEVLIYNPEPEEIINLMDKIIQFDKKIEQMNR